MACFGLERNNHPISVYSQCVFSCAAIAQTYRRHSTPINSEYPVKKPKMAIKKISSRSKIKRPAAANLLGFPPTRPFVIAFCSRAESRQIADTEVLQNLTNVRKIALNAAINDTYHIRAGVARYPAARPDMSLTVRGAAVDIKNDLGSKGVTVPLG